MVSMARRAGSFCVSLEPKLGYVITISSKGMTPKVRQVVQLLHLSQTFSCTFVKLNKALINMLRIVEPYEYIPSRFLDLISENGLIYKHVYDKINKKLIVLADNTMIAGSFGKYGTICTEELKNEIYTVGKCFKEANYFSWPFKVE